MNIDPMSRERIREIRESMELNVTQFARELAVTRQTVNNWESGRTAAQGPTLVLLHQLAEKFRA
jgi:DNA-binding transcriptional regulator YiaG